MLVRLGFFVSLLAAFPLQMSPFRDALWKLLFRQQLQASAHACVECLGVHVHGPAAAAAMLPSCWHRTALHLCRDRDSGW